MKPVPTFAVKAILLVACSLTTMSIATISPSLPKIAEAFSSPAMPQMPAEAAMHSPLEHLTVELLAKMLLGIPALCIALGAPLAGWIVDKGYRKQMLIVSLGIYAVSGTSGLYLPTLTSLIIARIGLGTAIAGIMTSAQTLIADYFDGAEREQMMGLQGAFTAGGGVVLIAIAGVLTDAFGWRAPFCLYGASLALLPFVVWKLQEPVGDVPQTDTPMGTSTPQNVATRHGQHRQQQVRGQTQAQTETKTQWRILWRNNRWHMIAIICTTTFVGMGMYYTIPTQLPFFLRGLDVVEASRVGVMISSSTLIGGCVSALMPWLRGTRLLRSFHRLCALGFAAYGVGFVWLSQAQSYEAAFGATLLCGCGVGLLMPVLKLWTMNTAPLGIRGKAIGAMTAALFLGQFSSPLLAQPLVISYGISTLYSLAASSAVAIAAVYVLAHDSKHSMRDPIP